jgi:hypothetical protein
MCTAWLGGCQRPAIQNYRRVRDVKLEALKDRILHLGIVHSLWGCLHSGVLVLFVLLFYPGLACT